MWRVVSDLESYGEWNPFVVRARSDMKVGGDIVMHVKLFSFAQRQRETIIEYEEGSRVCWGIDGPLLTSRRCQDVRESEHGGARFESDFRLSGFAAPLVSALLGRRLDAGFRAMGEALKRRAESQAEGAAPQAGPR